MTRRIIIGIVVFLVVAGLFVVFTTPGLTADRQKVALSYKKHTKALPVLYDDTGKSYHCTKASNSFRGEGWVLHNYLLGGGMSISFCYDGPIQGPLAVSHIIGKPHVNIWGDVASYSLWSYEGVSSMVTNHGTKCNGNCWEYSYHRVYLKFTRGFKGAQQVCTPWIAITVRGTGSWVGDHSGGWC